MDRKDVERNGHVCFDPLSQNFPEEAKKKYENESGHPVLGLGFKLHIYIKKITHSNTM
jgi:hypothetical protein